MSDIDEELYFLLGPDSPSMRVIEELLVECGVPHEHAKDRSGNRVSRETAYRAVAPEGDVSHYVQCRADASASVRRINWLVDSDDTEPSIYRVISVLAVAGLIPRTWERAPDRVAELGEDSIGDVWDSSVGHVVICAEPTRVALVPVRYVLAARAEASRVAALPIAAD